MIAKNDPVSGLRPCEEDPYFKILILFLAFHHVNRTHIASFFTKVTMMCKHKQAT